MIRIGNLRFTALLPPTLAEDPSFSAAGTAVASLLRGVVSSTPNLLLWHRLALTAGCGTPGMLSPIQRVIDAAGGLKPLSEAELELLAWQFHVDFRDTAQNTEQLAGMVRQSIPWHSIKGTPASIKAALALYDITANIEEGVTGMHWASYQIGLPEIADVETVQLVTRVAYEMAPVRCRIARIFNEVYDFRPSVWGGGCMVRCVVEPVFRRVRV